MTAKKKNTEPTFEADLNRLEALAEKMEQGELPLEELMDAYEEGAKLAKALREKLDRARARLSEVKAGPDGSVSVRESDVASQDAPEDETEA